MIRPQASSAVTPSPFARIQYNQTSRNLQALCGSAAGLSDKQAAHDWAENFGRTMRDLSIHAKAAGIVVAEDSDVRRMLNYARDPLVPYMTSEWLQLAPDLVRGVEDTLRGLERGISLGEAFPLVLSAAPHIRASDSALPPSQLSVASPAAPPPQPSMPSSSLENMVPSPQGSGVDRAARPMRPLPQAASQRQQYTPLEDAPPLPSSTTTAVPRVPLPRHAAPVAAPVAAAPPAVSSRSTRKQSTANFNLPPDRPARWAACARCKHKKKGCVPDKKAEPPYSACSNCMRDRVACVAVTGASSRLRRRQTSLPPVAESSSNLRPGPYVLPPDGKYQDNPPAVPLRGTASVPLPDLLGWHSEVLAAMRAHTAASAALEEASRRRRTAWENYFALMGLAFNDNRTLTAAGASGGPPVTGKGNGKGKGKEHAPTFDIDGPEDDDGGSADEDDEYSVSRELEGDIEDPEGSMDLS